MDKENVTSEQSEFWPKCINFDSGTLYSAEDAALFRIKIRSSEDATLYIEKYGIAAFVRYLVHEYKTDSHRNFIADKSKFENDPTIGAKVLNAEIAWQLINTNCLLQLVLNLGRFKLDADIGNKLIELGYGDLVIKRVHLFEGLEYNLDLLLKVLANNGNRTLVGMDGVRGRARMEKLQLPEGGITIDVISAHTTLKLSQLSVFHRTDLEPILADYVDQFPDLTVQELLG
jgi:hypothetical protein